MNHRKTALLLSVAFLALVFTPMFAEDAQASTGSAFPTYINIDVVGVDVDLDAGDPIPVDVESGSSTEIILCVINNSTDPYDTCLLNIIGSSKGDMSITSDSVTYKEIGSEPVYFILTVSADKYTSTGNYAISFDINGYNPYGGVHFSNTLTVSANVESALALEGMYNQFFGIYPNTLPAPFDNPIVTAVVTILIWILLAVLVGYAILTPISAAVERRFPDSKFRDVQRSIFRMIFAIMVFTGIGECLQIIGANSEWIQAFNTISMAVYVVFGAIIAWDIWKCVINVLIRIFDEVDVKGVDSSLTPLLKMIGRIVISVVAVATILASFGVDLAGILISAGVISLGITLGAQNILGQFFSGIVLLSTRPFQKGDYVKINNEVYIVHKVKVMFTEFNNWDNDQIITMPNNVVTNATIINLTRDSKDTRIFIYISVAYEADLAKAKELMIQAAMEHPHVIKDGSRSMPGTRLTNFLDSGIEYRLSCFVDDFDNNSHYAGQIREAIYDLFVENGVSIPYNKLEVFLMDDCDGKRRPYDKEDADSAE
jgi:small-conductance mechanosensitive channel